MNEEMTFTPVREAAQVTERILDAAFSIFDGWYADEPRIDWHGFFDRLEMWTHSDFGSDMDSSAIKAVKKHVRKYKNEVG